MNGPAMKVGATDLAGKSFGRIARSLSVGNEPLELTRNDNRRPSEHWDRPGKRTCIFSS